MIFYGKSGEFATNRRDQQELGMLALQILQAALVYVNTLMIQDILAEPEWAGVLTTEDLRRRCSGPTSGPTAKSNST